MQIECVFFGPFREDSGEKNVSLETGAETVGGVLRELESEYPPLEGRLIDADGSGIAGKTVVTKNKRDVRHLEGLETPLEEGDVFRLVPSVYGGSDPIPSRQDRGSAFSGRSSKDGSCPNPRSCGNRSASSVNGSSRERSC